MSSIGEIFGKGANEITNDMNTIIGDKNGLTDAEYAELIQLLDQKKLTVDLSIMKALRMNILANKYLEGGGDKKIFEGVLDFEQNNPTPAPSNTNPVPTVPTPTGPIDNTKSGSMLDFSSPSNTIVKSLFLLSLTPMFAGTTNYYLICFGCTAAISYSLFKLIKP